MQSGDHHQAAQELSAMLADSRKSYQAIAGRVQQEQLRTLLLQRAAHRHELWMELVGDTRSEAGDRTKGGTLWGGGAPHHTCRARLGVQQQRGELAGGV